MSNETKQDVFNDLLEDLADACIALDGEGIGENLTNEDKQAYLKDYDAALPDDLPVIPEVVGVSIKEQKAKQSLGGALFDAILAASQLGRKNVGPLVNWMVDNDETYANAWLLGVWKVEETGEIVNLEAEK